MSGENRARDRGNRDLWYGLASVVWVALLAEWFILNIGNRVQDGDLEKTPDVAAWMALVIIQMMIWGWVAYLNLGIHHELRTSGSGWGAAILVSAVFLALAVPSVVVTLFSGEDILGSAESGYVVAVLLAGGFISVVPAVLVLHSVRLVCLSGWAWGDGALGVGRIRALRRQMRIAVTSLGVTIGVAIITTSFARNAIAERTDEFPIESEHVLLYGGLLTAIVFALFVYAKSAVDERAWIMIDDAMPDLDLDNGDEFVSRDKTRTEMASALGLGVSAREGFQDLVVIASPILGAIVTRFISS